MQRDLLIATALALAASACNGATVDPSELTAPDGRCTDGARSSTDLRSADRAVPPDGAAPPSGPENLAARADLLILTHASLAPAFEPLAAWKRARGLPVQVVTTAEAAEGRTGADEAARLRSYISWSHQSRGTRYVLLGGDTNLLPVRQVVQEMYNEAEDFWIHDALATDLYYADLDGDWDGDGDGVLAELEDGLDLMPDVAVGRVPARTGAEVTAWVVKTLRYERDAPADYQHKALLLGEWAGDLGGLSICSSTALEGVILPLLPDWVEVIRLYDPACPIPSGALATSAAIQLQHMNAGAGWVLNFGHGWRDTLCQVDQEGMDALDAGDRPSIYLTTECNACELDAPGQPRVACEDYVLRPGGGTAYVGNTEFGVGAPWLMAFYRDLIQRLYASPGVPLGDLVAETLRTFADPAEAAKPLSDLRWTYLVLILMGDPSMMVFTDRPRPLDTDATWEAGTLQVTVRDGAVPVSGATVALSAPGLLHVTVTGPEGVATFAWEEAPPEVSWTLTATAPNHLPAEAALRF